MSKGDEMYYIDDYEKYLLEKGSSKSTVSAYLADLDDFESYLKQLDKPLEKAKEEDFISYSDLLSNNGKSAATINRRISSIRSFYDYLIKRGAIKKNPCICLRSWREHVFVGKRQPTGVHNLLFHIFETTNIFPSNIRNLWTSYCQSLMPLHP